MHPASLEVDRLVARIKAEFVEMPGLRLTIVQGARLWGLQRAECEAVLRVLVDRQFLNVSGDGTYSRPTDGVLRNISLRPANAPLESRPARSRSAR